MLGFQARLAAAAVIVAQAALAAPIAVTGTARLTMAFGRIRMAGDDFRAGATREPTSSNPGIFAFCTPGRVCNVANSFAIDADPFSDWEETAFSDFEGMEAARTLFSVLFRARVLVPNLGEGEYFSAPVTFTGHIVGYEDASHPLFDLAVRGSGTAQFYGYQLGDPPEQWLISGSYQYSGAVEPVPEPATALLAAAGLFVALWSARRRRA
jgi:hypothetical protein